MVWTYSNPVYANANKTIIDCIIDHPTYGKIPYTADENDVESNGQELFNTIIANQSTIPIGPYVPKTVKAQPITRGTQTL
jgi:hypothetical protein